MGIAQIIRRIRVVIVRGIGAIVTIVGFLLLLASVPPNNTETGVLFVIGAVVVLFGIGIIMNPNTVYLGRRIDEDESEFVATKNQRRGR